ncbi:hypothetical protein [Streptomyces sp. CC224B]|uniref:hypothetical protein n=1 Tax=Streptomyces sp. CC224B TaxID=3044571 RepID=UPI0024A82CD4|nr:hypothetical protein [Streptomyces sp. CC224B]
MPTSTPGPDERRVRQHLLRHGVGPDAQLPPAPAHRPHGTPPRPRDWLDDILDDHATPSPAPAPEPAAVDVDVRVTVDQPITDHEQHQARRDWSWLWGHLRPLHTLTAGAVALVPVFGGWSMVTGWAVTLHSMRDDAGVGAAYSTAALALAVAVALDWNRRRWLTRLISITALVGGLGVLDWYDPVWFLTGVDR